MSGLASTVAKFWAPCGRSGSGSSPRARSHGGRHGGSPRGASTFEGILRVGRWVFAAVWCSPLGPIAEVGIGFVGRWLRSGSGASRGRIWTQRLPLQQRCSHSNTLCNGHVTNAWTHGQDLGCLLDPGFQMGLTVSTGVFARRLRTGRGRRLQSGTPQAQLFDTVFVPDREVLLHAVWLVRHRVGNDRVAPGSAAWI